MPSATASITREESLQQSTSARNDSIKLAGDATLSDSIPSHPLGVKPLGNQYLSDGPSARQSVGTWGSLPDEMVMIVMEHLDRTSLFNLGHTCKFFFAFAHSEDLWKTIFLQ
jgi:hypothetical protein